MTKYGGALLQGDTYYCQKGCAEMKGNQVKNANKYCCNRDFDVCKAYCQTSSTSSDPDLKKRKKNQERCEYGCTFWKENPTTPATCGSI